MLLVEKMPKTATIKDVCICFLVLQKPGSEVTW